MSQVSGIGRGAGSPAASGRTNAARGDAQAFREILAERVTFSRHAAERLQSRRIQLSRQDLAVLGEAMTKAQQAGANTAAVIMAQGIFIVAPKTQTVITTMAPRPEQPMQVISHVDALVLVGGTSDEGASSSRATDGGTLVAPHWSLMNADD
ncbi:MAG: flagellar hook associated protein [Firmicutes bacterium]|nr:flagellar hook associated protein [Bacillota bacterium]